MKFPPPPATPLRDELLIVTSRLNGLRGADSITPERMLLLALGAYVTWKLLRK